MSVVHTRAYTFVLRDLFQPTLVRPRCDDDLEQHISPSMSLFRDWTGSSVYCKQIKGPWREGGLRARAIRKLALGSGLLPQPRTWDFRACWGRSVWDEPSPEPPRSGRPSIPTWDPGSSAGYPRRGRGPFMHYVHDTIKPNAYNGTVLRIVITSSRWTDPIIGMDVKSSALSAFSFV